MSSEIPEFLKDHPEGAELKTYKGGCHCGKFRFEFEYPSFEVRPPTTCNCSFCITQGNINAYGKEAKNPFKWTKGSFDETAKYIWNTKQATYHFCPTCSILILWNGLGGIVGVNIRCFDDFSKIDLDNFKMVKANGAKDVPGEAPAKVLKRLAAEGKSTHNILPSLTTYPEPVENEEVSQYWTEHPEGAEILTHKGGCHCRKFAFEYDYPRLDARPPTTDNCSFCLKHASFIAYGKKPSKPLRWTKGTKDEMSVYRWNSMNVAWHFCSECSTMMFWNGPGVMGVNARCFDDFAQVDLSKIKLLKSNGAGWNPSNVKNMQ